MDPSSWLAGSAKLRSSRYHKKLSSPAKWASSFREVLSKSFNFLLRAVATSVVTLFNIYFYFLGFFLRKWFDFSLIHIKDSTFQLAENAKTFFLAYCIHNFPHLITLKKVYLHQNLTLEWPYWSWNYAVNSQDFQSDFLST